MKKLLGNLIAATIGLLFVLAALEVAMRILPVQNMPFMPVNAENPAQRHHPNQVHRWSKFADFSMTNTVRSNNHGFINDQDYTNGSALPLTAVVGDSYVEALMVPYAETVQGRLARALEGKRRVYSFAASGSPLSQYLVYADYARKNFAPDSFVFVIVGNDFDESHVKYKSAPGFHYFKDGANGLELQRMDWAPSWKGELIRKSRLALYLLQNVQIQTLFQSGEKTPDKKFAGNTDASVDPERLRISKQCVDAFLDRVDAATGVAPQRICMVVDSVRPQFYNPARRTEAKKSYFGIMRRYFMDRARARSMRVVDMDTPFLTDFSANGKRFEYEKDGHWNGRGHKIAADAVLKSGFLKTP